MRRRTDAFSRLVGTEFDRSTQSHARAVHVRRSQSANADRSEQGIPASQRALLVDRHAHDRRRVFSYVSDQASAEAELAGSFRRGRCTSSPSVWEGEVHLLSAARAICAFVAANVRYSARSKGLSAFLADSFQFQRHFFLFLEAISFVILSEAKNLGSIWVDPARETDQRCFVLLNMTALFMGSVLVSCSGWFVFLRDDNLKVLMTLCRRIYRLVGKDNRRAWGYHLPGIRQELSG